MSETGAKKYLVANPNLPDGLPAQIAKEFEGFMRKLETLEQFSYAIKDDDQWDLVFQKLLESKDCAVRAVLDL